MRRLIDIREKNNLTQTEIAKILKTSQSNYSRWESGTEFIPLKKLNDFCNYFDTNMDYAMGLTKKNKHTNKIELDNKKIGSNIKTFRKENNITQKELSTFLNTTQSTVSFYESGNTLILTSFAYQIAKRFNISLDWLCGRSEEKIIEK